MRYMSRFLWDFLLFLSWFNAQVKTARKNRLMEAQLFF